VGALEGCADDPDQHSHGCAGGGKPKPHSSRTG
jgi:hypothetical protein